MIPRTANKQHDDSTTIITNKTVLKNMLNLDENFPVSDSSLNNAFPLRVPQNYLNQIQNNAPTDPLLLQVIPQDQESLQSAGFSDDPVGDLEATTDIPGLIHKYHGRVLLMVTANCAIHCRFCFRRNYPYDEGVLSAQNWENATNYIANNKSISEVILSGGDPLMVGIKRLKQLTDLISQIPHVKRLRIHTRIPIVDPQKINSNHYQWLTELKLQPIIVVHCNHANELSESSINVLQQLRHYKIQLFNQSVLLKGINDSVEALSKLSEQLFDNGVTPYYLHQLDRANGTAHFMVEDDTALSIHKQLCNTLPGYLVPKLVREQLGKRSKSTIF
jgi:L-lysine 2,3-aminomutase